MRVLWFSVTPSLYDEKKYGGWIASLERIVKKYGNNIELAIAFEYQEDKLKVEKNGVVYYPINISNTVKDRLIEKVDFTYSWNRLKLKMLNVIEDFMPDVIQCFGSEWPYGLIAECTNIPVVIHMQGFSNIYSESCELVYSDWEYIRCNNFNPKVAFTTLTNKKKNEDGLSKERHLMKINRFFMGRTHWDEEIVRNYSPKSKYYYCPEALRPEIYDAPKWTSNKSENMRLITITQAGTLKGNEIILRTAKILKEQFNFPFKWEVAGNAEAFRVAERKTRIRHEDYNISLLGMIDASEVAEKLANSDLYIHPAIIDNSPNSLCEAQVIGCPVIAANVGGIASLVDDGKTGILYPYNEPHMLAFKIMELGQNRELLKFLLENEIKTAIERHNPEDIYLYLYSVYKNVLSCSDAEGDKYELSSEN